MYNNYEPQVDNGLYWNDERFVEPVSAYAAKTFGWMALGLAATFAVAFAAAVSGLWFMVLVQMPMIPFLLAIAELAAVIFLSARIKHMSVGTARAMFFLYAILNGLTFSGFFILYDVTSLILAFGMTALYFGALAAYGYVTKRDLSNLRSILLAGLIFLAVFAGYVTLLILQAKREQKKEAAGVLSHDALGNLSSGTYEKGERGGIGAADGTVGGAADVAADGAADVADGKKADGGKKGADEAKDCAGGGKEGKDGGQKGRLAGWISVRRGKMWLLVSLFVVGLAMVVGGSSLLVNAAKYLAARAGVSERIIALTVVAIGTSLPELVTSVFAAIKGESDIAVGNVVGSNIFNVLVVAGASSLFYPLAFTHVNLVDAAVALGAAVLLLAIVLIGKRKVGRVGGALMLIGFAAYYACLFAL